MINTNIYLIFLSDILSDALYKGLVGAASFVFLALLVFGGKYLYLTIFNKEKKKLWFTQKDRYEEFTEEQVDYLDYLQDLEQGGIIPVSKLTPDENMQLQNYRDFYKGKITYEEFLSKLELYKGMKSICIFCNEEIILDKKELKKKKFVCPKCDKENDIT